jgi:hypothetical protein
MGHHQIFNPGIYIFQWHDHRAEQKSPGIIRPIHYGIALTWDTSPPAVEKVSGNQN